MSTNPHADNGKLAEENKEVVQADVEGVNERSSENSSQSSSFDSEEERRQEQEQLQKEVVDHLRRKQEPLTMQQLAYQLKTGKKFIEEALDTLLRSK